MHHAALNASGVYSISLAPGTYFASTDVSSANLVNEIFDDVKCVGGLCEDSIARQTGAPIQVVSGGTLTRNFALSSGGTITGVVTDAASGEPLAGIGVRCVQARSRQEPDMLFDSAITDVAGAYSIDGLPTGVYFTHTFKTNAPVISPSTAALLGYVHEYFDDLCITCGSFASATDIGVTIGAVTPGVNFALTTGGRITGRVRRTDTLAPIPDVSRLGV